MKKNTSKKQPKSKQTRQAQKLGVVLGALESQVAPGTHARPITCVRVYCEPN